MKFNAGECKRNDCHYHHGCARRLQNGRPCMQNHAAQDHKGPPGLSTISMTSTSPPQSPSTHSPAITITQGPSKSQAFSTQTIDATQQDQPQETLYSLPLVQTKFSRLLPSSNSESSPLQFTQPLQPNQPRLFLDLFAGRSAPLTVAARAANLDHFVPFDIEYDPSLNILDDTLFEQLLQLVHSGVFGAIWSVPPCRLYSTLRKKDGGPPPLRSIHHLNGLPDFTPRQLQQVQESQEIHRRSAILCTAVFQQGGFAGKEQHINSLAWQEPFHQQFLRQCSCYFVSTRACKWGLDSSKIGLLQLSSRGMLSVSAANDYLTVHSSVPSQLNTHPHLLLPSSTSSNLGFLNRQHSIFLSPLGALFSPKHLFLQALVSPTVLEIRVQQTGQYRKPRTLSKRSENVGQPESSNSIFTSSSHKLAKTTKQIHSSMTKMCYPSYTTYNSAFLITTWIPPSFLFSPSNWTFYTSYSCYQKTQMPTLHSKASLACSPLQPVGLWEPNPKPNEDEPELQVCQNNWSSAKNDPGITRSLIQQEVGNNFVEEVQDIATAEKR